MAADLNLEWICSLPRSWTYGITRGGRVFFINEEAKSTTWLHPVTGEAVVTGHRRQSTDLPTGWEEAYTFEGARYYIKLAVRTHSVAPQEKDLAICSYEDYSLGNAVGQFFHMGLLGVRVDQWP
ncbi:pleckstrin homology domain-containing family A member 5 isoform X24 [Loxodonta africana]|uniref:pleckstrin homology domain-containing family A member 5 isoform X24 n=1 Tax=Loxodonta africana TaxID=9785 RepID=UPI0030D218E9